MQNKKDKRTKGVAVKATPGGVGKTVTSGSSDAKNGAVDSGKKVTPGKGDARKGWKK